MFPDSLIKNRILWSWAIMCCIVLPAIGQNSSAKSFPCLQDEKYRRLDFWFGEWDVYVKGKKTATSKVTKSTGGCTLHEDYRTIGHYSGRSMNYHDPSDKRYTQVWIDKFNVISVYKELESRPGYLLMQTEDTAGALTRMDYTLDRTNGNVTQTLKSSKDGGKTWKNTFVGIYKRAKTPH